MGRSISGRWYQHMRIGGGAAAGESGMDSTREATWDVVRQAENRTEDKART